MVTVEFAIMTGEVCHHDRGVCHDARGLCHHEGVTSTEIRRLAREFGFELAGVARAEPLVEDAQRYLDWVSQGKAGAMGYLSDRRATIRTDPRLLLPSAKSIISVGKLYNGTEPHST